MSEQLTIWDKLANKLPAPVLFIGGALLAPIVILIFLAELLYSIPSQNIRKKKNLITELKAFGVSEIEARRLVRGDCYWAEHRLNELKKEDFKKFKSKLDS
jgi:hypothetical protein